MKPGDIAQTGIWLRGTETVTHLERYRTEECAKTMERTALHYSVILGPMRFYVLKPGEENCPPVPDNISGPDVAFLVCESDVLAYAKQDGSHGGFVEDLDKQDLKRLRAITRHAYCKKFPGRMLNDEDCDILIEEIGVDTAISMLRQMSSNNVLH